MTDQGLSNRITELFERALELAPDERAAFLDGECGGDADMRSEVASLLAHDAQATEGFMRPSESGPYGVTDSESPDRLVGTRIGRYHLKSVIAAGGMGTVYLAEQDRPRRDVALKIVSAGVASREALRRFEFESQALARLRHPNIAHVYEAGVHESADGGGRPVPYFAMEYIPDARTITQYADDRELDTHGRLALFGKVCDAVHHGHQRGVIHRDLKPGNILVDAAGAPKVIDFGVARSTDSDVAVTTMRTDVGQIVGTLQYMSPEQCDADPGAIDTRSDVYSLGVVLYELLTGARPYDATGTTIYKATRLIKEAVPPAPSSIKRQLRGDVETIVIKAIEKDPARRYQSSGELGNDIRHVLRREPIEARTPTLWSRAVRWASLHPVASTAAFATVVAVVIILLLPSVTWLYSSRIPHEVKVSSDKSRADLISLAGDTLFAWDTGGIIDARMISQGSDRNVVIGFSREAQTPLVSKLCAFNAFGPYDKPIWTSRFEENEIPSTDRKGFTPEDFWVQYFDIFDVFPESEGPEIVASYANPFSLRAVRIYAMNGRLLYQIWHDGAVHGFFGMTAARLLIIASEDARCYWKDRGIPNVDERYPHLLFALQPEVGHISANVLDLDCRDADDCPVWCMYVSPPRMTDEFGMRRPRLPQFAQYRQDRNVQVTLFLRQNPAAAVSLILDEHGAVVARGPTSDGFKQLDDPPDVSQLDLADIRELPPCRDDTTAGDQP